MRYKRFCLLLFFCFISTTKLLSQQYIAPGFTLFGSEAGLNQSTITYLFQDSTGLMWVASYAGLHKFNGNKFQKINPTHFSDQKYGLVIRHIFQKGKNIYFLDDKNIYQYNFLSKKIELFYSYENESSFKILTLTQKGFYIYRFISNSIEFVHFNGQIEKIGITNSKRSAEQICTSGKFIYLTDNFGNLLIYKHEKQTLKSLQRVETEPIIQIISINDSVVWLKTTKGNYWYKNDSLIKTDFTILPEHTTFSHRKQLINITKYALSIYKLQNIQNNQSAIQQIELPKILKYSTKTIAIFDISDNIWLSIEGKGLLKINRNYLVFNNTYTDQLKDKFIRNIVQKNNTLYFNAVQDGIYCLSDNNLDKIALLNNIEIFEIKPLGTKYLLLATDKGFWTLDLHSRAFVQLNISNTQTQRITGLYKTRYNEYVFGTSNSTFIYRLKTKKNQFQLDTLVNVHFSIKYIEGIDSNALFVANIRGGFITLHFQNSSTHISPLKQENVVFNQLVKKNDTFFTASSNGLFVFNHAFSLLENHHFTIKLQNEFCYALQFDKRNNLWTSTNIGLFCLRPNNPNSHNYNIQQGLQNNEFNTRCVLQLENGALLFGGVTGFNVFSPKQLKPDSFSPTPFIEELSNANINIDLNNQKNLQLIENNVYINFKLSVYNLTESTKNTFFINIAKNNDPEFNWINLNNGTDFFLRDLSPGYYSIIAKAQNSEGIESETVELFSIEVKPVFYKRSSFILLISLLSIVIFYIIIAYNNKQKLNLKKKEIEQEQEINRMRQKIADDMHDELGAGLTRLTLMIENMHYLDENTELIQRSASLSRKLISTLRNIIWATNPENETILDLVDELKKYASEVFTDAKLIFQFTEKIQNPKLILNIIQKQNILLIFKEAINNIIKHAHAKKVSIEIIEAEKKLNISIEDNGIGFDEDDNLTGNGLRSMKRRAEDLGGVLEMQTKASKSTKITLKIKI